MIEYVNESVALIGYVVQQRFERHHDRTKQVGRPMAMNLIEHCTTTEDHDATCAQNGYCITSEMTEPMTVRRWKGMATVTFGN